MIHDEALRAQARRAYELGRLNDAWPAAGIVVGLAAMTTAFHGATPAVFVLAALAMTLAAVMTWMSGSGRRGALAGTVAAVLPIFGAEAGRSLGHVAIADVACLSWCVLSCVLGGALSAAVVVPLAGRYRASRSYWLSAYASVLLVGSMACACAGLLGVVGLVAGVGVATVPAVVVHRRGLRAYAA